MSRPLTKADEAVFNKLTDLNNFEFVFEVFRDDTCKAHKRLSESIMSLYAIATDESDDKDLGRVWKLANPHEEDGAGWQIILKQFDSVSKINMASQ